MRAYCLTPTAMSGGKSITDLSPCRMPFGHEGSHDQLGVNQLTPAQEERLHFLIEEASEVIKAATKILRHGYGSEVTEYNNRCDLMSELADVHFAANLLIWANEIDVKVVNQMIETKIAHPPRYLHYQTKPEVK